ncbi:FadR family transcriptional regulator [Brevibacillus composti]|uniref:FadR family transcriptional regulator n=1 Tax=Brevibacillus composti TaxID=2796470 RepID=A0A7T5EIB0_9BACL|nr:FadR/GntR family transcriptional regulator [Brevibacillus composti]QQE73146.1 FadR family transcriptional regulator [Brevibacillus composti]QUO40224.1 FadR family transcriptional regulator [Brevibacillus composti]
MTLKQPARMSLAEQVAHQMDSMIRTGKWPVGTRIPPEPELVNQLGVSRNTVREAVRALVHTGMLETRQGDGTYVSSSSDLGAALQRRCKRSNIVETLEVRSALEQEAARLAALRRTEEDVEEMLRWLRASDAAETIEQYIDADMKLHQSIIRAADNSILTELYEHMTEAIHRSIGETVERMIFSPASERFVAHKKIHKEMVEAIIDREPEAATQAVRAHIEASQQAMLRQEQGGSA